MRAVQHNRRMRGRILLVHGAGGGGWEWQVWRRVLSASGWTVDAPDLLPRAHDLAATSFDDYAAQVAGAIVAMREAPGARVVVGASLGGLLAARTIDATIDALVLVNAMPPTPWHRELPAPRDRGPIIPWGRDASFASTRRAMPDADDETCRFAAARWRDESARVLSDAAAGIDVARPACPILFVASDEDTDVPPELTARWAVAWRASLLRCRGASHVGPLLGRRAATWAAMVDAWLAAAVNERRDPALEPLDESPPTTPRGFRTD